jgi:hypothetical protein
LEVIGEITRLSFALTPPLPEGEEQMRGLPAGEEQAFLLGARGGMKMRLFCHPLKSMWISIDRNPI